MQILLTFFKIIFFYLILFSFFTSLNAKTEEFRCAKPREFSMVKTFNIKGRIDIIGNTVLCKPVGGICGDPNSDQYINNNDIDMMYINVDGDNATINHSSAYLDIPTGAELVWAGLYWQGIFEDPSESQQDLSRKVKFKVKDGTYVDVESNSTKHNWIYLDTGRDRWYYQGAKDITDLIIDKKNPHWYSVANIQTTEGTPGGGSYGAWSIVAIYKDDNEPLQNLVVYDGYQGVFNGNDSTTCAGQENNPKDACNYASRNTCPSSLASTGAANPIKVTLDGFLTPVTGEIFSSFALFSGEGDIAMDGDTLTLTSFESNTHTPMPVGGSSGSINPADNLQNSSITKNGLAVKDLEPQKTMSFNSSGLNEAWPNSLGIDIDFFNTSDIIKNKQKSTEVTLATTNDGYLPGVFAFSTNLYEPRVCYKQELFDENDNELKASNPASVGDTITIKTWISNMNKDGDYGDLEDAFKVEVSMELDTVNLQYEEDSFEMKKFGKPTEDYEDYTDDKDSDKIDWDNSTKTAKWRVGQGANRNNGGRLAANFTNASGKKISQDLIQFIQFEAEVIEAGNIVVDNVYKVSYRDDLLDTNFKGLPMEICADIDAAFVSNNPAKFNVVNATGGNGDYTDPKSVQTYLPTQVAKRIFNVKIISLNDAKTAKKSYNGAVSLSLVDGTNLSSAVSDANKKVACDGADSLIDYGAAISFKDTESESKQVVFDEAIENAYFKVTYPGGSSCSLDNFAVRPKEFDVLIDEVDPTTPAIKAENVTITYNANDDLGDATSKYDFALADLEITKDIVPASKTCNGELSLETTASFRDGTVDQAQLLNEVGVFNIKIEEKDSDLFAKVDLLDPVTSKIKIEKYDEEITIYPDHFAIGEIGNINQNDATFTYLAEGEELDNMALNFDFSVRAQNEDDETTKNYSDTCYSNDTNIVMNYTNVSPGANFPTDILYKEADTVLAAGTHFEENTADDNNLTTSTIKSKFIDGLADYQIRVNFTRVINIATNPFKVNFNSLNVSDKDHPDADTQITFTDTTGGSTIDRDATMYYGRTNSPRSRFAGDTAQRAFIYYEVFCGAGCNRALLPANPRYTNDPRWFVNPEHNNTTFGSPGVVSQKTPPPAGELVTLNTGDPSLLGDFFSLDYNATTRGYPYKTTMENNASSWLLHNQFISNDTNNEFEVEFEGNATAWAGEKETSTTTNTDNTANRVNRRSMW